MKFERMPTASAEGAILAHSVRAGERALKKGRSLSAADIVELRRAKVETIVAAKLEAGDVAEDLAARRLAAAICGPGLRAAEPFTGRCNLYAETGGLVLLERDRVDRVNLIDEALTVATLAPFDIVAPRQMVATIKVIPFAVSDAILARAETAAKESGPLIRIAPFVAHRVGLIQTRLDGPKESVLDKTAAVTRARLESFGSTLAEEIRCAHEPASLAAEIAKAIKRGLGPILIASASATTDRRDVLPAGIEAAGGDVVHVGMPVDPGNLMVLGRHGETAIVGLPGCARSPKLNGFDWVLARLLARQPVSKRDVMLMGAGGLLAEIETRPQPRDADLGSRAPEAPRIAALVLAAGRSSRMGERNKLLEPIDGKPMVRRVVEAVARADVAGIVVVTGHQAERVCAALAGIEIAVVHNPDFAAGLSTSLRAGIDALPKDVDGALVCLGDMPETRSADIDKLIAAFNPLEGRAICVPTHGGKRGNPVLWAARFFPAMRMLQGDVGAKHLIGEHVDEVCEVAVDASGVLLDLDTPEALASFHAGRRGTA